jgi:hypothetical protein
MELLKVILRQVAVTFNLPTTDPEAKINIFSDAVIAPICRAIL